MDVLRIYPVLSCNGRFKEITGSSDRTTNNRMELQAVIAGLQALTSRCQVTVVTHSQYVVTILNNGRAKANRDLVQQVRQLVCQHDITVQQVRGHNGHQMNERCDRLANVEARQRQQAITHCQEVVPCAV